MSAATTVAVASIRDSVCAVLRISATPNPGQFAGAIVGTAWCISNANTYVTAYHVFNNGQPRNAPDKFYLLRAPQNGHVLQSWPVTAFRFDNPDRDLALIDAPVPAALGFQVPPVQIAIDIPPDGADVLAYGCPAPVINALNVTPQGDLVSIHTTLFTHANTGIVSAQYPVIPTGEIVFEFSVGWHHGESGGPVVRLEPTVAAISAMQNYRAIQAPHGTMAGPWRGWSLTAIAANLQQACASFS